MLFVIFFFKQIVDHIILSLQIIFILQNILIQKKQMGCCKSKITDVTIPALDQSQTSKFQNPDVLFKSGDIFVNIEESKDIQIMRKKITDILNKAKQLQKNSKSQLKSNTIADFISIGNKEKDKFQKAAKDAIRHNSITVTNLLNMLIDLNPEAKQVIQKQGGEQIKSYGFLKAFIYLYTGDFLYGPISKAFSKSQYQKVAAIVVKLKQQIDKLRTSDSKLFGKIQLGGIQRLLKNKNGQSKFIQVYRGIRKYDKRIVKGKDRYSWRSFTSTSLKRDVAQRFAKGNQGYSLYNIKLNRYRPHDHIIVPEEWTQYNDQQQILLFPFFSFECTNKQDLSGTLIYDIQQYDQKKHKDNK